MFWLFALAKIKKTVITINIAELMTGVFYDKARRSKPIVWYQVAISHMYKWNSQDIPVKLVSLEMFAGGIHTLVLWTAEFLISAHKSGENLAMVIVNMNQ